jgi:hypothetical protein
MGPPAGRSRSAGSAGRVVSCLCVMGAAPVACQPTAYEAVHVIGSFGSFEALPRDRDSSLGYGLTLAETHGQPLVRPHVEDLRSELVRL